MTDELRQWTRQNVGARPLTTNRVMSLHRLAWARHTRYARSAWCALWLEKPRVPTGLDAVEVHVQPLHATRRSPQDVAACAPEAKPAIDALVDAGVIPDDTPDHLRRVVFLPPELDSGVDGLRITVVDLTDT